jgi:hypothetical protein
MYRSEQLLLIPATAFVIFCCFRARDAPVALFLCSVCPTAKGELCIFVPRHPFTGSVIFATWTQQGCSVFGCLMQVRLEQSANTGLHVVAAVTRILALLSPHSFFACFSAVSLLVRLIKSERTNQLHIVPSSPTNKMACTSRLAHFIDDLDSCRYLHHQLEGFSVFVLI